MSFLVVDDTFLLDPCDNLPQLYSWLKKVFLANQFFGEPPSKNVTVKTPVRTKGVGFKHIWFFHPYVPGGNDLIWHIFWWLVGSTTNKRSYDHLFSGLGPCLSDTSLVKLWIGISAGMWKCGRPGELRARVEEALTGWRVKLETLGGGNSNILYFHPENWGRWTHFDEHIFFKRVETTN